MGNRKANYHRTVLRLPDLDHSKSAVLNSLASPRSRRVYQYAIEQFTTSVEAQSRTDSQRRGPEVFLWEVSPDQSWETLGLYRDCPGRRGRIEAGFFRPGQFR